MCGIAGYVAGIADDDGRPAVRRMTDALVHRGPDAEGHWSHGRGALGFRRLSIVDLSPSANQPFTSEDGSIGAVVNGEIYNHVALRGELQARGHVFRSRSDAEVVVHLYEEKGVDLARELDGMFALAIWDGRAERLVMARDRSGKKPLVYRHLHGGGLAFASELPALVRGLPEHRCTPNLPAIDEYLTLQYVPSPATAYREIHKLEAAHVAVFSPGKGLSMKRYWEKPAGPPLRGSTEDVARELLVLLEAAVDKRLVADVPLGAFLSGGLDSSTIVALMAKRTGRPVKTFSIGFPDADDSELAWARKVAAHFGTEHHEEIVHPTMTDALTTSVRHHGEPFGDSSAIATYYLARLARQHVKVALSGDGGDETFGGYTRYATARVGHVYDALPTWARPAYKGGVASVMKLVAPHVLGYARHMSEGEAVRYPYIMCQFTPEEKAVMYGPAMRGLPPCETPLRFGRVLSSSTQTSALGRLVDLDWQTYLADDIHAKVDTASMAHGLEVRCPLLDTAVVELAARLPARMLALTRGKRLLRRAARGLLPREILSRRKRGFGLPLRRWMKRDLGPMVRDLLFDKTARERGLFDPAYVRHLVDSLDSSRDAPDRIWTLLVLEVWFRELVDGAPRS